MSENKAPEPGAPAEAEPEEAMPNQTEAETAPEQAEKPKKEKGPKGSPTEAKKPAQKPKRPGALSTPFQIFGFVFGLVALVLVWIAPPVLGMEHVGMHMLAIFCMCFIFWIFNPIPPQLTAMVLVFLPPILGVTTLQVAVSGWHIPVTWFLVGGMIIGRMVMTTGLDKRITLNIVKLVGGDKISVWKLLVSIMIVSFIIGFIVPSDTVRALVIGAQVFPLVALFGLDEKSNVAKMLMLTVPITVLLFGNHTISGSSHSIVIMGCLEQENIPFTWLGWFLAILPDSIFVCIVLFIVFKFTLKPEKTYIEGGKEEIQRQLNELGPMSGDEKEALVLFIIALVGWITSSWTGIHVAHIALAIAIFAMLPRIGVLDFAESIRKLNWSIIIFTAGVLSIGDLMAACGLEDAFSQMFHMMSPLFDSYWKMIIFMWILAQITAWLGLAIGSPLLFLPFMFPICAAMGIPPVYAALCQGYMQPVCMYYHAPAPLLCAEYGAYQQSDYIKYQFVVVAAKIIITPFLAGIWWPFLINVGILAF